MSVGPAIYTCGHSDRPAEAFLSLLEQAQVRTLVDVRARPASRRHPQFGRDALDRTLAGDGIGYVWLGAELGGHRRPLEQSPNTALAPDGFRGYADYMSTARFRQGMDHLLALADAGAAAVMCAERLPEHCHRSLIADWLVTQGRDVIHLLAPGTVAVHTLSPLARIEGDRLVYDRNTTGTLGFD